MLKIILFPFVLAVLGAVVLGSFGAMKNKKPQGFSNVVLGAVVLGGIIAEICGAVLFDKGSFATAILLLGLGLIVEVAALIMAATNVFFSLTPAVAGEMDRLNVTPEQRAKIRKTAWKYFRRFQKA